VTTPRNIKRAIDYLHASGAAAIWIVERDCAGSLAAKDQRGVCTIHTGTKISATGTVAARWWTAAPDATRVASAARQLAGRDPDQAGHGGGTARSGLATGDVDG
jgi:hypothetical protein